MESELADLSNPENFFFRVPLYRELRWEQYRNDGQVLAVIEFSRPLDAFCPKCGETSIFKRERPGSGRLPMPIKGPAVPSDDLGAHLHGPAASSPASGFSEQDILYWAFHCSRDRRHIIEFWGRLTVTEIQKDAKLYPGGKTTRLGTGETVSLVLSGSLIKVGQYPSAADLYAQDVQKYRKLLGKSYSDFTRAIGLFTHGVGTGSFVYLRRIFESLIEEVHVQEKAEVGWDEGAYQRKRWDERIEMLSDKLPDFLVKNSKVYSILSKGIHELDEDECLSLFPIVKASIEFILDDKLAMLEREAKKKEAEKALADAHGRLKTR